MTSCTLASATRTAGSTGASLAPWCATLPHWTRPEPGSYLPKTASSARTPSGARAPPRARRAAGGAVGRRRADEGEAAVGAHAELGHAAVEGRRPDVLRRAAVGVHAEHLD